MSLHHSLQWLQVLLVWSQASLTRHLKVRWPRILWPWCLQAQAMGCWALKPHQVAELFLILRALMNCSPMFHLEAGWFPVRQQSSSQLRTVWQFAGNLRQVSQLLLTLLSWIRLWLLSQMRGSGCLIVQH